MSNFLLWGTGQNVYLRNLDQRNKRYICMGNANGCRLWIEENQKRWIFKMKENRKFWRYINKIPQVENQDIHEETVK